MHAQDGRSPGMGACAWTSRSPWRDTMRAQHRASNACVEADRPCCRKVAPADGLSYCGARSWLLPAAQCCRQCDSQGSWRLSLVWVIDESPPESAVLTSRAVICSHESSPVSGQPDLAIRAGCIATICVMTKRLWSREYARRNLRCIAIAPFIGLPKELQHART